MLGEVICISGWCGSVRDVGSEAWRCVSECVCTRESVYEVEDCVSPGVEWEGRAVVEE